MSKLYCGIDWSERHHDVAIIDQDGGLISKQRIPDTAEGFTQLLALLAAAGDRADQLIPVAIETPRGLMVAAIRATGRPLYPINPMAVARYRDRHAVSRGKSDHGDALVLANILRTDEHVHRVVPDDSELARQIAVLARAHQDATWRRARASNELRSVLREFYPNFLDAFAGHQDFLISADARAVLAIAPTPAAATKLTHARVAAALRRGGRQRHIDERAGHYLAVLRRNQLRQQPLVEAAYGDHILALLATLNAEDTNVDRLGRTCAQAFAQHPDYEIITSFPGLGDQAGARILAEVGDDRHRFADARALRAYAGSAPITRASGRSLSITHRRIKNDRLAAVGFMWAFSASSRAGGAKDHYRRRRDTHGDHHAAATRHLFNRLLGCLYHCLQTRELFDPDKAFTTTT